MLLHTKELKNLSAAEQKFLLKSAKDGRLKSGAVDLTKIYTEGRRLTLMRRRRKKNIKIISLTSFHNKLAFIKRVLIGKRSSSVHFSFYFSTFCHSIVFALLIFYFLKIVNF